MRLGPLPRIMTFLRSARVGLAGAFVARIEIRREALELRRAGIHAVEDGADAQRLALLAHGDLVHAPGLGQLHVGDAEALGLREFVAGYGIERAPRSTCASKSTISLICSRNHGSMEVISWISSTRVAAGEGEADVVQAVRRGGDELLRDERLVVLLRAEGLAGFEAPHAPSTAPP